MDRRELEYIIVIAQEKNLSKAAERLYVSQPALSRFLLKLETQAGLPLFERKKRQLVPTLAGELYLDTARKMLQLDQDLERQLKKLRECTHGKLTIGITPGRGHTVLPRVLPDFGRRCADLGAAASGRCPGSGIFYHVRIRTGDSESVSLSAHLPGRNRSVCAQKWPL